MEESKSKRLSFEEFKLFYESTEKVTDRRLETNRWNYSICIGILVGIAGITNWLLTNRFFLLVGAISVCSISLMALLFCALWTRQIRDFKNLNNAKFAVLNEMAPRLEFDVTNPEGMESFLPFEKEWQKVSALHGLEEVNSMGIVALKSSNMEYFIPKAFQYVFGVIPVVILIFLAANWSTATSNWLKLPPPDAAKSAPARTK